MTKSNGIKIHVHDFAGHPFQAELSNALSESGFTLKHTFFTHVGPTKALAEDIHNSGRIEFEAIVLKQKYEVHNLLKRLLFEAKLAMKLLLIHWRFQPSLTIFANTPLLSASIFRFFTPRAAFILWHQDIFSRAIGMRFKSDNTELNAVQRLQVKIIEFLERRLAKGSSEVICISDAFLSVYTKWSLDLSKVTVIENWAPLDQIHFVPRIRNGLSDLYLIYAGTLGLKHNPELLLQLMAELKKTRSGAELVIISDGDGANYVRNRISAKDPVSVSGFVPISTLNQKLADSDLALMLLEEGASDFSVPSKTYSYLAAGKCIVAFAPKDNAASISIIKAGGFVFEPTTDGVHDAVDLILGLNDIELTQKEFLAREFALDNFQITKKVEAFDRIINKTLSIS